MVQIAEQETVIGISRSRSMTAPQVVADAKPASSLEQNLATWWSWSPGTAEDALLSKGVSIRVPSTTLSAIGQDLGQQHVHGSQPRALPVWLMSQNLFTRSWAGQHPFLQPQATPDTPATASRPCLSLPTLKKQVGPTGLLQPVPPLHTTCFGAIMSRPFTSDPVWGHGQGQEEYERWSEECGSILEPQTFLVVSPGSQWDGAPQPALVMLCTAATLQPPVVTPGEDATLFRVEAAGDGGALLDRDMAGIRRVFQLLVEDIMEEVEVLADEEQQQGSSQDLEEKMLGNQGQERLGGLNELLALDALQALATLQVTLSSEHEKNCRAYVSFMCNSHQRRKRDLAQRSAIIQGISGFWAKVVTFLLLLGICCLGGGGGAEAGAGGWVGTRAQDGCWWTLKEVWYWATGRLQKHS